jgi:nucleoside 2-deoxyribosyltransferase-like protein/pfkB family carbohydrate kinase
MLHVVGGTYLESCLSPWWFELVGSGLRASFTAHNLGTDVEFHTYIDEFHEQTLKSKTAGQITLRTNPTSPTIRFSYVHSLSAPLIIPPSHSVQKPEPITVEGENVLRFGMLEAEAIVHGERVVFDPQNPHRPLAFHENGSTAEQLAIVANRAEGRFLTGEREQEPERIALALLEKFGCAVVVIKCGSYGSVVYDGKTTITVPAFRTDKVWLIGSGDVFAGAFARYWACDGVSPFVAAENASKATAWYSNTMTLDFPSKFPASITFPPAILKTGAQRRVYLAGPFFTLAQNWLIGEAVEALEGQGLSVFSPLHHVGRGSASEIYGGDIKGLKECDIVFACADGFDSGTIYEIGYAHSQGKMVIAYVENEPRERLKMLEGGGCIIENDFVTAVYKTNWLANA